MPPSPPQLVLRDGSCQPTKATLTPGSEVTLGRSDDCDLVLDDPRASRRHARVWADSNGVHVEDLGSSIGLQVDGLEVERKTLRGGSRLRIGGVEFELVAAAASADGDAGRDDALAHHLLDAMTGLLSDEGRPLDLQLAVMLERLCQALHADRGAIFTPADEGFERRAFRARPGLDDPRALERPISRGLVARAASSGEPLLSTSLETEALRDDHESIPDDLRSILAAPLPLGERPGVLYLDSLADRRRFGDRDRAMLTAFARGAGVAIQGEAERRTHRRRARPPGAAHQRGWARVGFIAEAPCMKPVVADIQRASATDVTVLVTGESGTGKELVASALHAGGQRSTQDLVALNCAAIPPELVESELFGHEAGAFSGATSARPGYFELADGGTLFLDEVGELPPESQAKLLRALQERTVQRVGGSKPIPVDFRLVCATNVDLKAAAEAGRFREDLYYRIAVFHLHLPPLRARGDDILRLAEQAMRHFAREYRRDLVGLAEDGAARLLEHSWPGNIRELRNVVEQAVVRERGDRLTAASLFPAGKPTRVATDAAPSFPDDYEEGRRQWERAFLTHHLRLRQGAMTATAEALGMSRRNLYNRCKDAGVDPQAFRDE